MDNVRLACYALVASAFALAGMLALAMSRHEATAHAEMVIARDNFTLMTAQTRAGVESLFVLDNQSGRLFIYNTGRRGEIEFVGGGDLGQIFSRAAQGGGNAGGGGGGR